MNRTNKKEYNDEKCKWKQRNRREQKQKRKRVRVRVRVKEEKNTSSEYIVDAYNFLKCKQKCSRRASRPIKMEYI